MTIYVVNWETLGKKACNVFDFVTTAPDDPGAYAGMEGPQRVGQTMINHLFAGVADTTTLVSVESPSQPALNWTFGQAGSNTGNGASPSTAYLIHKNPPGGRRGRFFLPGVVESTPDAAGVMSAASLATWQTRLDAWLGSFGPAGLLMRIPRSAGGFSQVLGFQMDPLVGVQRRRLRRGG